jgi:CO/xanthine dehydrogenase Mo-binding subunit
MTVEALSPDVLAALLEPEERVEGHLKVRGVARYAADASWPGMLHSALLYSPIAHGRLVRIDASAAKAMPGVHAVLTGEDLGSTMYGRRVRDWPLLARDRVRFVGDRVAVVAAETAQQA